MTTPGRSSGGWIPRPFIGVSVTLPLRGHFHLFASVLVDRAIDCQMTLQFQGMRKSVLRREGRLLGSVSADGLADVRALTGAVTYREASEGQALFTARFTSDGLGGGHVGETLTLRGFVEVLPVAPLATATTMPFSLYSALDDEIGRGAMRLDLRGDLGRVLGSVRPTLTLGREPPPFWGETA